MSSSAQRALDYLEQQPGTTFTKLYQQPSTALAIFRRMLPHLAKTLVLAMLYLPAPFPAAGLEAWVKPATKSNQAKEQARSTLQRLRILFEESNPADGGRTAYRLSPAFAKSLRQALTGGGSHSSFGVACSTPDKTPVTVEYLDAFARRQWEAILYYVVGSANASLSGEVEITPGTKKLLQDGGYVVLRGGGRQRVITTEGFTFLLQESNAQVWSLLCLYLDQCPALQMDPVDVLSFLFTLGSLELGVSYSSSNLTPTQLRMLEDLTDFGIVYRRSGDSSRYYPTRLATTLTSDSPALTNSTAMATTTTGPTSSLAETATSKGYVILETNYRLYAYTSSPLLISILSLFAHLHTRYPNLITAKLTKPSIQSAITLGITSNQIIDYLTSHAHPVLHRPHTPILPPTVVDQIRLWQMEGERMESVKGYLIRDVGSMEDYDKAVKFARDLNVLVKEFRSRGSFFVTRMDQMGLYFKEAAAKKKAAKEMAEARAVTAAAAGKS